MAGDLLALFSHLERLDNANRLQLAGLFGISTTREAVSSIFDDLSHLSHLHASRRKPTSDGFRLLLAMVKQRFRDRHHNSHSSLLF